VTLLATSPDAAARIREDRGFAHIARTLSFRDRPSRARTIIVTDATRSRFESWAQLVSRAYTLVDVRFAAERIAKAGPDACAFALASLLDDRLALGKSVLLVGDLPLTRECRYMSGDANAICRWRDRIDEPWTFIETRTSHELVRCAQTPPL